MKSVFFAAIAVLSLAVPKASAQNVTWSQPNVATAAQAQGLTYSLTTTPPGGSAGSPVTLTSVVCTGSGTAPITAACSAPLPSTASGAIVTGAKSTLTATDTVNGTGTSLPSLPFIPGAAVPTGLVIK